MSDFCEKDLKVGLKDVTLMYSLEVNDDFADFHAHKTHTVLT